MSLRLKVSEINAEPLGKVHHEVHPFRPSDAEVLLKPHWWVNLFDENTQLFGNEPFDIRLNLFGKRFGPRPRNGETNFAATTNHFLRPQSSMPIIELDQDIAEISLFQFDQLLKPSPITIG